MNCILFKKAGLNENGNGSLPPTNTFIKLKTFQSVPGWSGGAMVLVKLPVPGRPTIWIIVRQGPIALAVGAGGGCLDIFTLLSFLSSFSLSLKNYLKGP